ncbi:uncharacterized protein LOC106153396 [Lingula anatina]|uniref:Uncharacterized protein LOC106153396 n=1 Tax=Lingula anatina TaxID=7574 RepID=A0A1S3H9S0_LINAN|nr:uncharacterized protein LOC106153396 [Lingula anatina]|eukprot:XP_013382757.1 uncharacterized protein LOC106153396 [Lingula anatina]
MPDVRFTTLLPLLTAVLGLTFLVHETAAQGDVIIGCPTYGCTPSGTFSSVLGNFPQGNVTVRWTSQVSQAPLPGSPLGCVGNDVNIVCPAIRLKGTGYVSVNPINGSIQWTDELLRFPPLPIMNIGGDIIACDGNSLVYYFNSGKMNGKAITMEPSERPVYSLTMANNNLFFIISRQSGRLITYTTDGIPMGSIYINDKINSQTGAFVPIAQPVIAGHRVYILMEFKVNNGGTQPSAPILRLYAVDLRDIMVQIIKVIWIYNFTSEVETPRSFLGDIGGYLPNDDPSGPRLMVYRHYVYLVIPAETNDVASSGTNGVKNRLLVFHDNGTSGTLKYTQDLDVVRMAAEESLNTAVPKPHHPPQNQGQRSQINRASDNLRAIFGQEVYDIPERFMGLAKPVARGPVRLRRDSTLRFHPSAHQQRIKESNPEVQAIWLATRSGGLYRMKYDDGDILTTLQLSKALNVSSFNMTSELMIISSQDGNAQGPVLVFAGIAETATSAAKNGDVPSMSIFYNYMYVVDIKGSVKLALPVPMNGTVQGQIMGIPTDDDPSRQSDLLVAYSRVSEGNQLFAYGYHKTK